MADYNVTIKLNPPDLLDPAQLRPAIERGLVKAILVVEAASKDNVTSFTRTGRLRSSITHKTSGMEATVGTRVNYARFVESGTKPHIIRPRNKEVLRWATGGKSAAGLGRGPQGTLKGKGSFAFAKEVRHPGFAGHHYFERALDSSRDDIVRILQAEITAALH